MIRIYISPVEIVPYVRMTQRGKYVKRDAQRYLASQEALALQLKNFMQNNGFNMIPKGNPIRVTMTYYAPTNPGHGADLDNQLKAILDACKGIVFEDDRWVDSINIQRIFNKSGSEPSLTMFVDYYSGF